MIGYIFALMIFFVLWLLLFLCAIIYHNKFEAVKKIFCFDFKHISKVEFWMSLFISFIIAAIISYSLI